MSFNYEKEVLCHSCKLKSKAIVYPRINVSKSPYLKEQILDGSLFMWQCPHCSYKALLEYPLLYHDMDKQLMIYFIPGADKHNYISDDIFQRRYPQLGIMTKRIVSSLNELKEKIFIFDSELDDMYIELTKYNLSQALERKMSDHINSSRFCSFDENTPNLGFAFFFKDRQEPCLHNVKTAAYEKAADIVDEYLAKTSIRPGFLKIDKAWAMEVMDMELSWE